MESAHQREWIAVHVGTPRGMPLPGAPAGNQIGRMMLSQFLGVVFSGYLTDDVMGFGSLNDSIYLLYTDRAEQMLPNLKELLDAIFPFGGFFEIARRQGGEWVAIHPEVISNINWLFDYERQELVDSRASDLRAAFLKLLESRLERNSGGRT
jgi:hypothetical protein